MLSLYPVVSTSIDAVAYDDATSVLYLRFKDTKALYAYYDVPRQRLEELLAADAKGSYVNTVIKPGFRARRVQKLPAARRAS